MELDILMSILTAKDTKQGYGAFLELERLSEETDDLYPYTERFAEMISDQAWAVRAGDSGSSASRPAGTTQASSIVTLTGRW